MPDERHSRAETCSRPARSLSASTCSSRWRAYSARDCKVERRCRTPAASPPDQLDSWLAIAPDGTVSVFTSKVDLGTGTGTALGQIVAEELDVAVLKIRMEIGDTTQERRSGTHVRKPHARARRTADAPGGGGGAAGIAEARIRCSSARLRISSP